MKSEKKASVQKPIGVLVSEPFKMITLNMTYVRNFAGVFAMFMVVGIPILAEKSVPGDMLYAVKTDITEELRASLKLSPYAKVEWETERLERRVAEARLLASEGKLTPEAQAVVALAVQEHTDAAVQEIAAMREDDADEAAIAEIAFASVLSVQSDVLEGQGENVDEGYSIAVLADAVSIASKEADVAQAETSISYEVLLGSVETETTRAYELFVSVQERAQQEEVADMQRRLDDVERKLVQAIRIHDDIDTEPVVTEIEIEEAPAEEVIEVVDTEVTATGTDETGVEIDAPETQAQSSVTFVTQQVDPVELLRTALADVQKLIIFMSDIEVREHVTIEELVPVTPTDDEKTQVVLTTLDEVLEIQSDIKRRAIAQKIADKVEVGTDALAVAIESVKNLLQIGDVDGAHMSATEALNIAHDVQNLIFSVSPPEVADEVEESVEEIVDEDVPVEEENEVDIVIEEKAPEEIKVVQ